MVQANYLNVFLKIKDHTLNDYKFRVQAIIRSYDQRIKLKALLNPGSGFCHNQTWFVPPAVYVDFLFLWYNVHMKTELTLNLYSKTFVFVDKSLKSLAKMAIKELETVNSQMALDSIKKLKKNQMFFNIGKGQIVCSIIEKE